MVLLRNIISNYLLLKADFTGITFNIEGITTFFLRILITLFIFLVFYLLGEKIRNKWFKENKSYTFFINIAFGFICIGTTVGLLGAFSLLQKNYLIASLFGILLVSFYPFKVSSQVFLNKIKTVLDEIKPQKTIVLLAVLLFVGVAFLRLITPEITEDAYHTDLPRLYLESSTTIHETKDPLHVIPYPQLAEMIYIIPVFLGDKEIARFIHFGFYLITILLIFAIAKNTKNAFVAYAPLLFVTAPIVIRYTSTQYIDFFLVFVFLLSTILIKKNISLRSVTLSGIILGAALSVKIWTVVYIPAVALYLGIINRRFERSHLVKLLGVFFLSVLVVPLLWYVRNFIITGSPLYPFFSNLETKTIAGLSFSSYLGFNSNMFSLANLIVLSPLFFLGIVFCLLYFRKVIKTVKIFPFLLFFIVLTIEQVIVKVDLGRYLLAWYTIATVFVSAGIFYALRRSFFARIIFISLYFIMFLYYLLSTLFVLPYGLGWADKNAYLTRVLGRDNASYYDFNHLFDKWISKNDLVATYGIFGYYYANFSYIDVNYIFQERDFNLLKKRGATRLLIKGGNIEWFCSQLSLRNCDKRKVKLLAVFPKDVKKYFLYKIEY